MHVCICLFMHVCMYMEPLYAYACISGFKLTTNGCVNSMFFNHRHLPGMHMCMDVTRSICVNEYPVLLNIR